MSGGEGSIATVKCYFNDMAGEGSIAILKTWYKELGRDGAQSLAW